MKKSYIALLGCFLSLTATAQITLVSGTGNGGFESFPANFFANGWTPVNAGANQWAMGTGSAVGTRGAYIGNTTTYAGTNSGSTNINHFYRSNPGIAIPADATNVQLTFLYRQPVADPGWDSLIVSVTPTVTATPVAGTTVSPAHDRIYVNTATAYTNYTAIGPLDLTAYAGNNIRLVFTHVNDGSNPLGVPAVDSISVTYCPAIAAATYTVCPGAAITLNCPNPAPGGAWSSSDATIASIGASTSTTADINGITAGTATITHTGGTCTVTATVTVSSPVVPSVSISSSVPGMLCAGTSVTYTANPVNEGPTPSYVWYVNGTPSGTGNTYSYIPTNGDVVSTTLYPGGICVSPDSANSSQTITVTPLSNPSVAISVGPSNPSCLGEPVTFSALPALGGTAPMFRWTKNGVNVATGPTYSYIPAMGDLVYCTLTSNYLCRLSDTAVSSTISMMTQASASLPEVTIAATPGTTIDPGTAVTLVASYTGGTSAVTYQWHINGTAVPGATDNTFVTDTFADGDIVTCKVTNTDPCARFTLESVVINTTGSAGIGNTGMAAGMLTISPNPNTGTFRLNGHISGATAEISIISAMGNIVKKQTIVSNNGKVTEYMNLEGLPKGVYLLRMSDGNNNQSVRFTVL